MKMCGRERHTCVVDGDTIWLDGVNLRLESFDTPEPYNNICGGQTEVALARRASSRLLGLLNGYSWTVETGGADRYGRVLAIIRISGRDIGDILIEEGWLAVGRTGTNSGVDPIVTTVTLEAAVRRDRETCGLWTRLRDHTLEAVPLVSAFENG